MINCRIEGAQLTVRILENSLLEVFQLAGDVVKPEGKSQAEKPKQEHPCVYHSAHSQFVLVGTIGTLALLRDHAGNVLMLSEDLIEPVASSADAIACAV